MFPVIEPDPTVSAAQSVQVALTTHV